MLAFARAHMADMRRPSRIATQAAVSSVSAATENAVVRALGARNDWRNSSRESAEECSGRTQASGSALGTALVITSASARSERGEGLARSGACVRCAGARGRSVELGSKIVSVNVGSDASVVKQRYGTGCFVPSATAAPKAIKLSRTESIAQVVSRRSCCAGWRAGGEHVSDCAGFASGGSAKAVGAAGEDASRSGGDACTEGDAAGMPGRAAVVAGGTRFVTWRTA
eukprot:2004856-Pleurochrysis_carterae.AAC.1